MLLLEAAAHFWGGHNWVLSAGRLVMGFFQTSPSSTYTVDLIHAHCSEQPIMEHTHVCPAVPRGPVAPRVMQMAEELGG